MTVGIASQGMNVEGDELGRRRSPDGSVAAALPRFNGVSTRYLRAEERPYRARLPTVPLVLAAEGDPSQGFLEGVLRDNHEAIVAAIVDHGAVLLRGFEVASERGFEAAISSIPAFRPMRGYFMAEEGRTVVGPGSNVFHTNELERTGGGFRLPGRGFHTENYYSADVPAFLSFWCKRPGWLGGETALSHVSRAYEELGDTLHRRLETEGVCLANRWPLEAVAQRYSLAPPVARQVLGTLGLSLRGEAQPHVIVEKRPVLQHPCKDRKSLLVNLSNELPGFNEAMVERFVPEYRGWRWLLHRYAWRRPDVLRAALVLSALPMVSSSRKALLHHARKGLRRWDSRPKPGSTPQDLGCGSKLADKLGEADIRALADAVFRHSSVFTWRRGDVLILDNLQMAHAGMPGWGPREVRAMLCNPIRFPFESDAGVPKAIVDRDYRSIHDRLSEIEPAQGFVSEARGVAHAGDRPRAAIRFA